MKKSLFITILLLLIVLFPVSSINDFTCSIDNRPFLKDKMPVVCDFSDINSYCCVVNIFKNDSLISSSPELNNISNSFLNIFSKKESRKCFESENSLLNAYYSNKNLRVNRNFTVNVYCQQNNGTVKESNYSINPVYEPADKIIDYKIWIADNSSFLISGLIIFSLLLLIILIGVKRLR